MTMVTLMTGFPAETPSLGPGKRDVHNDFRHLFWLPHGFVPPCFTAFVAQMEMKPKPMASPPRPLCLYTDDQGLQTSGY